MNVNFVVNHSRLNILNKLMNKQCMVQPINIHVRFVTKHLHKKEINKHMNRECIDRFNERFKIIILI